MAAELMRRGIVLDSVTFAGPSFPMMRTFREKRFFGSCTFVMYVFSSLSNGSATFTPTQQSKAGTSIALTFLPPQSWDRKLAKSRTPKLL